MNPTRNSIWHCITKKYCEEVTIPLENNRPVVQSLLDYQQHQHSFVITQKKGVYYVDMSRNGVLIERKEDRRDMNDKRNWNIIGPTKQHIPCENDNDSIEI